MTLRFPEVTLAALPTLRFDAQELAVLGLEVTATFPFARLGGKGGQEG